MENQLLKKAIDSGFITFDGLCSSWQKLSKVSQGIDPQVLDAILTVKPSWVDHMYSPMYFGYNALIFSLYLVRPVELKSITLLGLAIAYEDAAAEDVIKKHYSKLGCDESAVAVIGADTRQKVSSDLLRELVKIGKTKNVRPNILTEKVKALLMSLSGNGFIKTAEERRYFSPYVMENLNKIFGYMGGVLWGDDLASSILSVCFEEKKTLNTEPKWCVKDVVGKKAIPYSHRYLHYGVCSLPLEGMNKKIEESSVFCAEKVIIQKREVNGTWIGDPIDLTSFWPDQTLAVGVFPAGNLCYFAPVFKVNSLSEDFNNFLTFIREMDLYLEERVNVLRPCSDARAMCIDGETITCRKFLIWLKDHCS